MSEQTIVGKIKADRSVSFTDEDAATLGLQPGDHLVLQVRKAGAGNSASFHGTVSVAKGSERKTPRAFQ